ncbi:MAG: hypothetical protein IJ819_00220 [Clostridiales bacterium]|nr:hypothetical protein [Clostridiales bacterium]
MNKLLWKDAKIDKPTKYDLVLVCTDNGCVVIAQWDGSTWWDSDTGDSFGGVQHFAEFTLPHGWKISDHYYEGDE